MESTSAKKTENTQVGESTEVLIGNREWMFQNGVDLPRQVDLLLIKQEEKGETAVLVAANGKTFAPSMVYTVCPQKQQRELNYCF